MEKTEIMDRNTVTLNGLAETLRAHKRPATAIVSICFLLGAVAAALLPRTFTYSTTLAIGSLSVDRDGRPVYIEDPLSVQAKLVNTYIPIAAQQHPEFTDGGRSPPGVEVLTPRGTYLILLQSRGRPSDAGSISDLHAALVEMVRKEHSGVTDSARLGLLSSIEGVTARLQSVDAEDAMLRADAERLAQRETRLLEEQARSKALLDQNTEWQGRAVTKEEGEIEGAGALLLNSMATQYESRARELRERLDVELPGKRDAVLRQIAANATSRRVLEGERATLQSKQASLQATKALALAARSVYPSGPSRLLVVALATLVGVGLAGLWVAVRSASPALGRPPATPVAAPAA